MIGEIEQNYMYGRSSSKASRALATHHDLGKLFQIPKKKDSRPARGISRRSAKS